MSAQLGLSFDQARADREIWRRVVESAVGAHIANAAAAGECEHLYWRDGDAIAVERFLQTPVARLTVGRTLDRALSQDILTRAR